MKKMSHLKQYEDYCYTTSLQLMLFQFFLQFSLSIRKGIKQSISDSRNLKDIALKNKWDSVRSGILTSLEDEVIVVTDAKLTIVLLHRI
jgi:hypothetical protein